MRSVFNASDTEKHQGRRERVSDTLSRVGHLKFLVFGEMNAIKTLKGSVKLAFSILCSVAVLAAALVLLLALLEQAVRFL